MPPESSSKQVKKMIDNGGDVAATEVCPGCFGTGVKIVAGKGAKICGRLPAAKW
jgi:hypothetical protein